MDDKVSPSLVLHGGEFCLLHVVIFFKSNALLLCHTMAPRKEVTGTVAAREQGASWLALMLQSKW